MPKILIAEDDPDLRELIHLTLGGSEFETVEAEDGLAAVELARRERPDLVFLDWSMPGLTGIEVCRALRADPSLAHAKVVMITARGREADRAEAIDAGVDEFVSKPFSPVHLLDTVYGALGGPGARL